jgi:hypothetical protein
MFFIVLKVKELGIETCKLLYGYSKELEVLTELQERALFIGGRASCF